MVLLQSVLNTIPLYSLQLMNPPMKVLKRMETIFNKFMWGSKEEHRKTHWSKWKDLCYPKEEGGLGFRRPQEWVKIFGMKWWWKFRSQTSLWARFILDKYGKGRPPSEMVVGPNNSSTWKWIMSNKQVINPIIRWGVGVGRILFWHDHWCKAGVLAVRLPLAHHTMDPVSKFFNAGSWDSIAVNRLLPCLLAAEVLDTPINSRDDMIMWDREKSCSFNCREAWQLCRSRRPISSIMGGLWHNNFPISFSLFMWRLLKGYIHVDVKLQSMGISLASKCQCCAEIEDLPHLFLQSSVAVAVWEHCCGWFRMAVPIHNNIRQAFMAWRGRQGGNCLGHIRTLSAMIIFKQIWMDRNKAKHDLIKMNHKNIIAKVERKIWILVRAGIINSKDCKGERWFKDLFGVRQPSSHSRVERAFRWIKPSAGWFKLNSDGCSKGNPGSSAGGGLLRDHQGRLIFAFAKFLGINSSFMAELLALQIGISKCLELRINCLWIEVDSLALCRCINGGNAPNWKAYNIVVGILCMLRKIRWKCSHIWREGNCAADLLANLAIAPNTWLVWLGHTPIKRLNGMMRLDRLGLEYIRRK